MDLTSPKIIKELLIKYETRPAKGLGQNFLIDKNVLNKIIESADIKPSDIILEIGPGLGTLTQELAEKSKKVIAIEKDETMIGILKETLASFKNVEIIGGDVLKILNSNFIRNSKIEIRNYKVVANIPYYLTSPLIRKLLEAEDKPDFMILMVQKEVAQRICSKPPNMSLLSVSVQFYAEPKIVSYVSKSCFWPSPKVDSAIIKITPRCPTSPQLGLCRTSPDLFFKVVKAGFSQPRKQLIGNLLKMLKIERPQTEKWLLDNKIDPTQRAETLSVDDWTKLANSLPNNSPNN